METEERNVLAKSTFTPNDVRMLQERRAVRRHGQVVLICILYGLFLSGMLMRIVWQTVKILIFKQPVYSAVSLWFTIVGILACTVFLIWFLCAPRRHAKRRMRQLSEAYPTVPTFTVTFYEDEIVLKRSESEHGARFCYPAVKRCFETPDLFVLETKERQFFSLEKAHLLVVDAPGFRRLITEKCPKAKCRFINDGGK